ncbi:hypothetical protein Pint_20561 [Pistacia integerrima]|uniref:Uncharacterized protein n=1 Tax=Pistacia integerrima TaxID=434235 RepID=A0ACC0XCI5_9ROSI|nr:hypothetical protein Pint_20561 [Pistacia integerrima]
MECLFIFIYLFFVIVLFPLALTIYWLSFSLCNLSFCANNLCVQFVLQQFDNPLSKKLNEVINEIRSQRCSYLRLKLCKKGDQSGQ